MDLLRPPSEPRVVSNGVCVNDGGTEYEGFRSGMGIFIMRGVIVGRTDVLARGV